MNCDVSFGIPDGYDCGTAAEQWNTRADLHAELVKAADELAAEADLVAQNTYEYDLAAAITAYKQAKEKMG